MTVRRPLSKFLPWVLAPLLLAGCEADNGLPDAGSAEAGTSAASIRPPAMLGFRAIDRSQLFPVIVVGAQTPVLESDGGDVWLVQLTVPPNRTVDVTITWFERFEGVDLPLVRAAFPAHGRRERSRS